MSKHYGTIRNGVYYKNEDESNRLRLGGSSWSINLDEIRDQDVNAFEYKTDEAVYRISIADAHAHGMERRLGGEDKLVVPVKYWSISDE